jgi:hypothetical protein
VTIVSELSLSVPDGALSVMARGVVTSSMPKKMREYRTRAPAQLEVRGWLSARRRAITLLNQRPIPRDPALSN